MFILRAMFSNHGASYTVRETISEFFQLKLNATYHICTPVTEGELYKKLCWEAQPQGLNPLPGIGSRPPCCIPLWQKTYTFRITDFPILWFAPTCEISISFYIPKGWKRYLPVIAFIGSSPTLSKLLIWRQKWVAGIRHKRQDKSRVILNKTLPNHCWTRYHFRDTIGYHSNNMSC